VRRRLIVRNVCQFCACVVLTALSPRAPGEAAQMRLEGSMPHSLANFAAVIVLIGMGLQLSSCSEKRDGDTSFREASKGFEKELTSDQRKAAIKQLQTETNSKPQ
jgi:hypothetical protein